MAAAAVERLALDLGDRPVEVLDPSVMLPQVAQGALAVECRADEPSISALLAAVEHRESRWAVDAERAFLAELGGDCDLPAGAHAVVAGGEIVVEALLASMDGHTVLRERRRDHVAEGTRLGRELARFLLDDAGGSALLER